MSSFHYPTPGIGENRYLNRPTPIASRSSPIARPGVSGPNQAPAGNVGVSQGRPAASPFSSRPMGAAPIQPISPATPAARPQSAAPVQRPPTQPFAQQPAQRPAQPSFDPTQLQSQLSARADQQTQRQGEMDRWYMDQHSRAADQQAANDKLIRDLANGQAGFFDTGGHGYAPLSPDARIGMMQALSESGRNIGITPPQQQMQAFQAPAPELQSLAAISDLTNAQAKDPMRLFQGLANSPEAVRYIGMAGLGIDPEAARAIPGVMSSEPVTQENYDQALASGRLGAAGEAMRDEGGLFDVLNASSRSAGWNDPSSPARQAFNEYVHRSYPTADDFRWATNQVPNPQGHPWLERKIAAPLQEMMLTPFGAGTGVFNWDRNWQRQQLMNEMLSEIGYQY